jgi:hypothetical protein
MTTGIPKKVTGLPASLRATISGYTRAPARATAVISLALK